MLKENYLTRIEAVRETGAVVLLKWDGERESDGCTVVLTHHSIDYAYRRDSSDMDELIASALDDYEAFYKAHTAT